MSRLLIVFLLMLAFLSGKGQDSIPVRDTVPKFHFGFVLGINGSTTKVVKANMYNLTGEWLDTLNRSEFASTAGFYMGFLFQHDFSSRFSLRASPGFNILEYAMNYFWKNGDEDLVVRRLVFFQLPLHLSVMVPVKKCRLSFLPGINLIYHHSEYNFANEPRFFTAADLRIEFSRPVKKKIIGLEFGFNRSFKTHEIQMAPSPSYTMVTDRIKPGSFMWGLTLKY